MTVHVPLCVGDVLTDGHGHVRLVVISVNERADRVHLAPYASLTDGADFPLGLVKGTHKVLFALGAERLSHIANLRAREHRSDQP